MLISAHFPFTDHRAVTVPGFRALDRPGWPSPIADREYVRGVGLVRERPKSGFEGWVNEDRMALRVNAVALGLPRALRAGPGSHRVRLVRKACYFDGVMNGRFEVLLQVADWNGSWEAADLGRAQALVEAVMRVPATSRQGGLACDLHDAGRAFRDAWALGTVKRGSPAHPERVHAAPPTYVVESDTPLSARLPDLSHPPTNDRISITIRRRRGAEVIALCPSPEGASTSVAFRWTSRQVRTYLLRLKQDVESLLLLLGLAEADVDDDAAQFAFNLYTRQIYRARRNISDAVSEDGIAYCYALFERMNPGAVAAIRVRLHRSRVRPNVKRKLMEFLDLAEEAGSAAVVVQRVDKIIFGDNVEIGGDVSGSGIAIGRGASAQVAMAPPLAAPPPALTPTPGANVSTAWQEGPDDG